MNQQTGLVQVQELTRSRQLRPDPWQLTNAAIATRPGRSLTNP